MKAIIVEGKSNYYIYFRNSKDLQNTFRLNN